MKKLVVIIAAIAIIFTACSSQPVKPEGTTDDGVTPPAQEETSGIVEKPPVQTPEPGPEEETPVEEVAPYTGEEPISTQKSPDAAVMVAAYISSFYSTLESINDYYDDGIRGMASFGLESGRLAFDSFSGKSGIVLAGIILPASSGGPPAGAIPAEYQIPLPSDGSIAAPAGACPAGAKPSVVFENNDGMEVTPELFDGMDLETIPFSMLQGQQGDPGTLLAVMNDLISLNDRSLATPQGWNEKLWEPLQEYQSPAGSLMDYQLWNVAGDLERQIDGIYLEQLEAYGAPQNVIDAYNASDKAGWYSSESPDPEDALAQMEILAEMTGDIEGIVHEQRNFSITGAGEDPVYGEQTGYGTVTFDHPELGPMDFEVDILLDQFDEQGRAVAGNVIAGNAENGYTIRITFQPDGTKKGEVIKDGELVGTIDMSIDSEKFETYIDVHTSESIEMPEIY